MPSLPLCMLPGRASSADNNVQRGLGHRQGWRCSSKLRREFNSIDATVELQGNRIILAVRYKRSKIRHTGSRFVLPRTVLAIHIGSNPTHLVKTESNTLETTKPMRGVQRVWCVGTAVCDRLVAHIWKTGRITGFAFLAGAAF